MTRKNFGRRWWFFGVSGGCAAAFSQFHIVQNYDSHRTIGEPWNCLIKVPKMTGSVPPSLLHIWVIVYLEQNLTEEQSNIYKGNIKTLISKKKLLKYLFLLTLAREKNNIKSN